MCVCVCVCVVDQLSLNTASYSAASTISRVYLFLTPNSRSVFRAGVSLNIHAFAAAPRLSVGTHNVNFHN